MIRERFEVCTECSIEGRIRTRKIYLVAVRCKKTKLSPRNNFRKLKITNMKHGITGLTAKLATNKTNKVCFFNILITHRLCHAHHPRPRVHPGHDPSRGVIHLDHCARLVHVQVHHVGVDHSRGGTALGDLVRAQAGVRGVALGRGQWLRSAELA